MVKAITAMHHHLDPARYAMLPDVVERYASWLPVRAMDDQSVFLVATLDASDTTLAGFLIATIETSIPIYALEKFGFIHDVWVEPHARGRGLAGELVAEAAERFKALGITQIRLETAAENDASRKVFAPSGFRVATVEMLRDLD